MAQRFKAKTLLANSGIFNNEVVAPNLVYNTGNQTISGTKTFSVGGAFETRIAGGGISFNISDNGDAGVSIGYGGIDSNEGLGLSADNELTLKSRGTDPITFATNDIQRAIITSGGNFGIGTELPSEALEVNGNIKAVSGVYALNLVYNTGNQTINGIKNFTSRPKVNGTEVLLSGDSVNAVIPSTVVRTTGDQTIIGLKIFSSGLISNVGITGNNLVYNTGNQSIGGLKTFLNGLISNVGITGINLVYNTGSQTISGVKTFNASTIFSSGIVAGNVVYNTGSQIVSGVKTFSDGLVSNVGITGTNLVYNTGSQTISGVKTFNASTIFSNGLTSTTSITVPNVVYNTGSQIVSGVKTFFDGLVSNVGITGTNLVYNTGSQIISGVKTFFDGLICNGLTSTTSITVPNVVYNTGSQIVSGVKNFDQRPTVNGTGILLSGEAVKGFTGDLRVSLSGNKTFGRYFNGETIPASGKTITEVLELALIEPIIPTVNFNSSSAINFNQTQINNTLNASYTINSLKSPYSSAKASIKTGYIEWKRSNAINWNVLTINTAPSFSFTHTLTDTQFNPTGFNYRYIVADDLNATNTGIINISPSPYIAPTLSNISVGVSPVDLGNVNVSLFAVINKNSSNVDFVSYLPQYHTGNNNWTNIGSSVFLPNASFEFSLTHNNLSLVNATGISYRLQVVDQYQATGLLLGTRSFLYRNYFGYSTNTSLTLTQIQALSNNILSNSKARTVSAVNPGVGNYTYYCYRASEGDLTSITDGVEQFLGSFEKLTDVAGTNTYGASVTYRVYKSNATNAFAPNTTLIFN